MDFPGGTVVKNLPASLGDAGETGLIPGSGRSPGAGNDNLPQCSCQENSKVRETWRATVWGCTESDTTENTHIHII